MNTGHPLGYSYLQILTFAVKILVKTSYEHYQAIFSLKI